MTTEKKKPWCFGKRTIPMLGINCLLCNAETYNKCTRESMKRNSNLGVRK